MMTDQTTGLQKKEVQGIIGGLHHDIMDLLENMVLINSYSGNQSGVKQMLDLMTESLPSAFRPMTIPEQDQGPVRSFDHPAHGLSPIMLVGHVDTVFPPGTFEGPLRDDGVNLYGPGVADMKGGLTVIVGALWVLERLGLLPDIPLCVAINGDEETGSLHSGDILERLARNCRFGFVFECGGAEGAVVTARRGLRRYHLLIKGQAGHSGFVTGEKQSALLELAHQIIRLEAFNKPKLGVSVNVGLARGGTAVNVIPGEAEADLEIRYWDEEMGNASADRLMASLAAPLVNGLVHELTQTHVRPAMPKTAGISEVYGRSLEIANQYGRQLPEESRLGASDASNLSALGLPVLDGLGPIGQWDHSPREMISKESLFQRVELLVYLLWGMGSWQPGGERQEEKIGLEKPRKGLQRLKSKKNVSNTDS